MLRRGICANCVNQATIAQKLVQPKPCERSQKPIKHQENIKKMRFIPV
jgi:hypothetical protein